MNKNQKKFEGRTSRKSPRLNQEVGCFVASSDINNSRPTDLQLFKRNFSNQRKHDIFIEDVYEKAQNARENMKGKTGLIYDESMVNHHCLWDPHHQECPDRFSKTLDRCKELGLVERCEQISVREATEEELLKVHSQAHIDRLKSTANCPDVDRMEQFASNYDAVYIHPETYKLALLSAGCVTQLVHEICSGTVHNGMAIVRPPGHHAMYSEFCGYCFFNNVAVAARHALDVLNVHKVLIVDWDVHHGQATQQMFYNDPRIIYFSIHRYEHGNFWPNLRESEFDYVGEGLGAGFNFNIPLNKTEMGDADYLAIFHQVLLPMAAEFQPDLVIVSAGYDAALGCPEGEMNVTPACYAHLTSSLMGLASGKLAVVLEGGYCVRSLAEGAALTLRALLGDPCPNLSPMSAPSDSIQESILNCIYSHRPFWKCFQWQNSFNARDRDLDNPKQHWPQVRYIYQDQKRETYPTRNTCPVQTQDFKDEINKKLDSLMAGTKLFKPQHDVCFVYDSLMMEHQNLKDPSHPERPSRIQRIYEKHLEFNLLDRLHILQSRCVTWEEMLLVHEESYLKELQQLCDSTQQLTDDLKHKLSLLEKQDSVYIHPQSYNSASLAAGSLLKVVDSVLKAESRAGVAVIRPPGHHAESYQACGFCLLNNISIAARYAIKNYGIKRVLILDWDVHHGNGTQRIFLSDPQVLYMSIHRYDRGTFFPSSKDAAATVTGSGPGVGFNVNIPWNQKGMGNAEYVAAFLQVVLPIAYQFSPELVLVSAGFDAAAGDPLGGCKVTPEAYALLTSWLMPLAMGRVIMCLEGGYNLTSIAYSMTMCTKTLLGDPVPPVTLNTLKPAAAIDLRSVLDVQSKHWSALRFNKSLPREDVISSANSNEQLISKLSIDDHGDTKSTIDNTIDNLSSRFNSEMYITKDAPIVHGQKPNLQEWNDLVVQAPNNSNNSTSNSNVDGNATPGPSQPSSSNGATGGRPSTTLDAILKGLGVDEGFAVYPRHDCPHIPAVAAVPASGINVSAPCHDCLPDPCATVENWSCLTCYTVFCGRVIKEHMMQHSVVSSHPIVLGFQDLSVWCYKCDSYIESPALYDARNSAYLSKFGQPMPNIYLK